MGVYLTSVYLTDVYLMDVYLKGVCIVHLTGVDLIPLGGRCDSFLLPPNFLGMVKRCTRIFQ
jgi:hypothetical protein